MYSLPIGLQVKIEAIESLIKEYDAAFRDLFDRPDKKYLFRNLRNEWLYRFEYSYLKIRKELLDEFFELRKLECQNWVDSK